MATMNISLPTQMKNWVEESVKSGRFANSSDYVRDLIRRDKDHNNAIAHMQVLITEGVESGVSDLSVDDVWDRVKQRHGNG